MDNKRLKIVRKLKELVEKFEEEEDERDLLFGDDFVNELAMRIYDKGLDVTPDQIVNVVKKQSIQGMYAADDKDEYYNYKTRFQKSEDIANAVMHLIQREAEVDAEEERKASFVDFSNASKNMKIYEKAKSKSQQRLMGMVKAYKEAKRDNNTQAIHDLFDGVPQSLEKKIKNMAGSMSMDDVDDYAETEHDGLPEKINEDELEERFRKEVRSYVRENLSELVGGLSMSKDKKKVKPQMR